MRSFHYGRAARFLCRQHPEAGVQLIWLAKKASRYCQMQTLVTPQIFSPTQTGCSLAKIQPELARYQAYSDFRCCM